MQLYRFSPIKDKEQLALTLSEIDLESRKRETAIIEEEKATREKTLELFEGVNYGEKIKLNGDISFCFRDAGHILGSAFIEVFAEGKKIVFSGDLGNLHNSIMPVADEIEEADYALIESTYGNRIHEDAEKRRDSGKTRNDS